MTSTVLNNRLPITHSGSGFWQRLWAALEAHGQRRAEAELRRIAVLHASTDPELARHLRELAHKSAAR